MTLEADGMIEIYDIESGKVVATYEGLEVHTLLSSIQGPEHDKRIAKAKKLLYAIINESEGYEDKLKELAIELCQLLGDVPDWMKNG